MGASTVHAEGPKLDEELEVLDRIQRRVLWLAISMVHHANKVRGNGSGVKVGGHQASSASMVSIMTALYFEHLDAGDRVSVKPHASPVLHAINYLLGRLERPYLTQLRAFGGLQSYPSRTKDPDPVDFSTGSVGIGATAPIWSALAQRYVSTHFDTPGSGRHIALVGDAELDEGAVWEALVDPMVPRLGEVLWVVDLNRQSLDRVVPGHRRRAHRGHVRGRGLEHDHPQVRARLRELFAREGGELLERRIDDMSNEEYQHLLRLPADELRAAWPVRPGTCGTTWLLEQLDDGAIARTSATSAGHDLGDLLGAFAERDRVTDRPSVIFAYTIKAWRLPTQGHPGNHSALLSTEQWHQLALELGADPDDPWAQFSPGSPESAVCDRRPSASPGRNYNQARPPSPRPSVGTAAAAPNRPSRLSDVSCSTCHAALPKSRRASSPSAPTSRRRPTSAGGSTGSASGTWTSARTGSPTTDQPSSTGASREKGQHIELGIAEVNLVGLLSELGLTWSRDGQPLLPIGTLLRPVRGPCPRAMVVRDLLGRPVDPHRHPLGRHPGARRRRPPVHHHAFDRPRAAAMHGLGAGVRAGPRVDAVARAGRLGRPEGTSGVLPAEHPAHRPGPGRRAGRGGAARTPPPGGAGGGYLLRDARQGLRCASSAWVPSCPKSSPPPRARGGRAWLDVMCLTSADLVFRAAPGATGPRRRADGILEHVLPGRTGGADGRSARRPPAHVVVPRHHQPRPISSLGVNDFGQVGDVADLYRHFGIDTATIVGAAWDLLDEVQARR